VPTSWLSNPDTREWDPAQEYWGEAGEPIEAWAKPIIKRGPRPMYEMEQILPGGDPEDFDSDPIMEENELKNRGQIARAKKLLEKRLIKDVRCLDAHAHLGNIAFDKHIRTARAHDQRGVLIGKLSLGEKTVERKPSWLLGSPSRLNTVIVALLQLKYLHRRRSQHPANCRAVTFTFICRCD
jgi:hypothetical protein